MSEENGDRAREALRHVEEVQAQTATVLAAPDFTKREASWLLTIEDDDAAKTKYTGVFKTKMPTLRESNRIGLTIGMLCNGVSYDSIPPHTRRRFDMLATFAVLLTERPDWFADPEAFDSEKVPVAVYERVMEHYRSYFRR